MQAIPQSIRLKFSSLVVLSGLALASQSACSESPGPGGSGGTASGGAASGGAVGSGGVVGSGGLVGSGGAGTGGGSSGGSPSTGGTGSGGLAQSGGASSGGGDGVGGASGGSGGAVGFQPCPAAEPCKILPLGDSITEGMVQVSGQYQFNGGYRVRLFELAVEGGKDVTFVGSRSPNGPDTVAGQPFPKEHEGTSGITIQDLADKANKYADGPHIVLLHIGTNDLNLNQEAGMTDRLEAFIDQITTEAPDALLVVAQLVPMPSKAANLATYNASMVGLVEEKVQAGKHVLLLDLFTDYPSGQLPDNIHPSADGYAWMGEQWYETIEPYLP